jgi:NAD(P)-dependent dehydrogenase (short-subunit alcohol dehydrogenase family)
LSRAVKKSSWNVKTSERPGPHSGITHCQASPAKPSRRTTIGKNVNLTGKTAVVTGAGSGIDRAMARLLAQHGAKVHVADLNADAAAAVANEIGANATALQLDVTRPEDLETLAETVFGADGRVDILHNNAGIGHGGDIEETTVEDWQRVIGVNLLGANNLVARGGIEPPTFRFSGGRSCRLSYLAGRQRVPRRAGDPDGTRTRDLRRDRAAR